MEEKKSFYAHLLKLEFTNDKIPQFVEPKKTAEQKFVKYGETNDYPQFLLTLFNRSAKHNSISTAKQAYIKGQGFVFDENGMEGEEVAKLRAFIDSPNPYEGLNDLLNKTALDEGLFGGFYIKGVNSRKGCIAEIYHVDYSKVRSNEDNTEFYISDHWLNEFGEENIKLKPDQYYTLPTYDPNKKQKEWLFYYKSYRPGLKTYTLPEYIGAVPAIITDAEIANFHRAEIQNSFKGSKMIVFKNGVPSDDEMKSTERRLKGKFTNTDAAGSIVIDFVDDPERVPDVIDLTAGDFDKKYEALNHTIQEEIFVGHRVVSPMLFGVRVEGQLGGRNEMIDAFNLFQNTYIGPKQAIQTMVYDYFAPVKGKLKIKPVEPIMPSFSETTLSTILTKDEMRAIIGRKPLEVQSNVNTSIVDDLNALSPLVANKVLSALTENEIRSIVNKPAIPGGDKIPTNTPAAFQKFAAADDELDFEIFSKYGEPAENFVCIKSKKVMFNSQEFLSKVEEGILDLIRKTPNITEESIRKVMQLDKTAVLDALESLIADGLIEMDGKTINATKSGEVAKTPTFEELYIRYKYVERPDAPALVEGGESRDFCKAMMASPRYFSKQDIESISQDLAGLYGIPNYDAFKRRGGWYHDPIEDINVPYCRHAWEQHLVKRVKR